MADFYEELGELLKRADGVKSVFFYFPKEILKDEDYPYVTYYELNNAPFSSADDREYSTEINIAVDVWAYSPREVNAVADNVTAVLVADGWRREFRRDLTDGSGVWRKNMRFGKIV